MTVPALTFRENAFVPESRWTLEGNELVVARDDRTTRLPLTEVWDVCLDYAPMRVARNRYRCRLTLRDGRIAVLLNLSWHSLGRFDDRSGQYRAFVAALMEALARANPACRMRTGKTWPRLVSEMLAAMTGLLAAGLSLVLVGVPITGIVLLKLLVFTGTAPALLRYTRRNMPRLVPVGPPPDAVLPPFPS